MPVPKLHAGDIAAVAKLKETQTGDTLCDKAHQITYPPVKWVEPVISFAIEPKSRGDEDKISTAIHKLMDEDLGLGYAREPQTKEFLLSGQGQMHVEMAVARLKKRYGVEVLLHPPKVPYRETIKGKADVQGKHKKQSGGHGQYGDCKIRMEPLPRGGDFEFVNEIFGGSIPRNFIPAVEKGIQEARQKGVLAGFPTVDFRVILYDGSYHDVDSSEMAFKIAGSLAFKKGIREAKPILLEPVMNVEVQGPEEFAGDLMGDLNSRRGRVQGMEVRGHTTVIKAQVPLVGNAELRVGPDVEDRRPRQLHDGIQPLRRSARPSRGQGHRECQGRRRPEKRKRKSQLDRRETMTARSTSTQSRGHTIRAITTAGPTPSSGRSRRSPRPRSADPIGCECIRPTASSRRTRVR